MSVGSVATTNDHRCVFLWLLLLVAVVPEASDVFGSCQLWVVVVVVVFDDDDDDVLDHDVVFYDDVLDHDVVVDGGCGDCFGVATIFVVAP